MEEIFLKKLHLLQEQLKEVSFEKTRQLGDILLLVRCGTLEGSLSRRQYGLIAGVMTFGPHEPIYTPVHARWRA